MKKKPKFLLLGWDSADWNVINPLLDNGEMPALDSLVNQGVMGNIATLDPPLSPMLWTSIATGKYAYKHGVKGFLEAGEVEGKIRPVTTKSIQAKTVWEILNEEGFKTNVVGWWPSHPAAKINGVQVSNFYAKAPQKSNWDNWPLAPESIQPKELEDALKELRVHPGELGVSQLSSFMPDLSITSEEDNKLINLLLNDLAECISIHAASTYLAVKTDWDFMAVYYNAIDHISHCFMKYHPPRLEWVKEEKFEIFKHVVNAAYKFHDLMLARWLELITEDTYVMVLSDHGFHSDHRRPGVLPKEPAAIAREHNYLGMVTLKGPGIKKDEIIYGCSLLDVAPTILALYDIPIGKDMDGKVWLSAFEKQISLNFIKTWDNEIKQQVSSSSLIQEDVLQQLVDLGYVDATDFANKGEVKKILDENEFYLARSLADGRKLNEAIQVMRTLCNQYPKVERYWFFLAKLYVDSNNAIDLAPTINHMDGFIDKSNQRLHLLKGKLAFLENNFQKAYEIFNALGQQYQAIPPHLSFQIANALLKLQQYNKAIFHYQKSLEKDPDNANALHGLGLCYYYLNQYDFAIDLLIDAVSITYFNPSAHYHLGLAFKATNQFKEAEQAFSVAMQIAPGMSKAKLALIELYEHELLDLTKAEELKKELEKNYKGIVYIVSGLPRSGTSMMMQMLAAGGLSVFTDEVRKADESNPKGYFEHEAVKRLPADNRFIYEAKDKLVKVIANLLSFLPRNLEYKVIMMKREHNQVMKSQSKMIRALKNSTANEEVFELDKKMKQSYQNAIDLLTNGQHFSFIEIDYEDLIYKPDNYLHAINEFLNKDLIIEEMKKCIDKNLHRNK